MKNKNSLILKFSMNFSVGISWNRGMLKTLSSIYAEAF